MEGGAFDHKGTLGMVYVTEYYLQYLTKKAPFIKHLKGLTLR